MFIEGMEYLLIVKNDGIWLDFGVPLGEGKGEDSQLESSHIFFLIWAGYYTWVTNDIIVDLAHSLCELGDTAI